MTGLLRIGGWFRFGSIRIHSEALYPFRKAMFSDVQYNECFTQ